MGSEATSGERGEEGGAGGLRREEALCNWYPERRETKRASLKMLSIPVTLTSLLRSVVI